ncbi:NAD(P)-dependent dehydrogenase (short-subunit alcohol dehydrogenase family) [Lentzea atacamensis]|uniref:NAD(P)-dependent dehydrogenase (Short-subunit alcohol dehydrogenase family) n=1 Tax=Lentzea atacamensis TaxID=531938 RepID=A0A316IW81_9PSEU|nr:SDR family oxidoreductase [Lentzea atacamensis]PWK91475.1 NAD(P)-dependent dehydrogenase (short-subunit alcohol dehydrogenase family) [Lentzea atacamensis]
MELQGQRALVTGATSGIGRAVAVKLADAGATVLTTGRRAGFGDTHHVVADLGNLDDVRRLADEVGEIDVLVNNAGIFPFGPTLDQDVETYEQVFDVNVRGPYFLTAALLPKMIAKGGGSIINISSVTARTGTPIMSVYGASKAALDSLTLSWAVEFGGHGIRVNSVAPGLTRTEKVEENLGDAIDDIVAPTPLGRAGSPEEIAEAVLFLASPRSSFLTGSIVTADGGALAT